MPDSNADPASVEHDDSPRARRVAAREARKQLAERRRREKEAAKEFAASKRNGTRAASSGRSIDSRSQEHESPRQEVDEDHSDEVSRTMDFTGVPATEPPDIEATNEETPDSAPEVGQAERGITKDEPIDRASVPEQTEFDANAEFDVNEGPADNTDESSFAEKLAAASAAAQQRVAVARAEATRLVEQATNERAAESERLERERQEAGTIIDAANAEAEMVVREATAERDEAKRELAEAAELASTARADADRKMAEVTTTVQETIETAQAEARAIAERAEVEAQRRVEEATAEAESRLAQADVDARRATDAKLQEAEQIALERIAAAEAEAIRVAQAAGDLPTSGQDPDESEEDARDIRAVSIGDVPREVSESGAPAPETKSVIRPS